MSTFSRYNQVVTQKLATAGLTFFTAEMRKQAVNEAIEQLVQRYDIADMIITSTLSFVSGVASRPSKYFKMAKLWIDSKEYEYITPDEADGLDSTASYYWTEDSDGSGVRTLKIYPSNTETLKIRYYVIPDKLTDESSESGLPAVWDDVIAYQACEILAENAGRYDEAQRYGAVGDRRTMEVIGATKNRGGKKEYPKFKSIYSTKSLLNR